jgi:hypothetical protein
MAQKAPEGSKTPYTTSRLTDASKSLDLCPFLKGLGQPPATEAVVFGQRRTPDNSLCSIESGEQPGRGFQWQGLILVRIDPQVLGFVVYWKSKG